MKRIFLISCLLVLVAGLALPTQALAYGLAEDKIVVGGAYTLKSGEVLDGDLALLGGIAVLEAGSRVDGDVAILGGTLEVSGEVSSNIVAMGGLIDLRDSAVVHGSVMVVGAQLVQAQGARVEGEVSTATDAPLSFTFPGNVTMPRFRVDFSPVVNFMWFLLRVFMWAALGVLVAVFLPAQVKRTAETAVNQPLAAGGLGLLTAVIAPFVLVILIITICLIPAALLGIIALVLAWAFGVVALGWETGRRLGRLLDQDWPDPVAAGVGTFVLVFIMDGAAALIPCIGWIVPALVGVVALGAVILSRFGTQAYPPLVPAAPLPPDAPLPPGWFPAAESGPAKPASDESVTKE